MHTTELRRSDRPQPILMLHNSDFSGTVCFIEDDATGEVLRWDLPGYVVEAIRADAVRELRECPPPGEWHFLPETPKPGVEVLIAVDPRRASAAATRGPLWWADPPAVGWLDTADQWISWRGQDPNPLPPGVVYAWREVPACPPLASVSPGAQADAFLESVLAAPRVMRVDPSGGTVSPVLPPAAAEILVKHAERLLGSVHHQLRELQESREAVSRLSAGSVADLAALRELRPLLTGQGAGAVLWRLAELEQRGEWEAP